MRILTALTLLVLAGCAHAPPPEVPPQLQPLRPLDTGLTKPCQRRPALPAAAAKLGLSERQLVDVIGRYDVALTDCSRRQAKIVEIYEHRDSAISGGVAK